MVHVLVICSCYSVSKGLQILLWQGAVDNLNDLLKRLALLWDFFCKGNSTVVAIKIWSSCTQELTPDQMTVDKSQTMRCPQWLPQYALCCLMLCLQNLKICGLIKAPLTAWDYSYLLPSNVNVGCIIILSQFYTGCVSVFFSFFFF